MRSATDKEHMIDVKYKVLGGVVLFAGILISMHVLHDSKPTQETELTQNSELAKRKGFSELKEHVQNLAAIQKMCRDKDESACYCELSQKITAEHEAIDRLLKDDPVLRTFVIAVRYPASAEPVERYDLNRLPAVPDETSCLNTVAAPTLIDGDTHDI